MAEKNGQTMAKSKRGKELEQSGGGDRNRPDRTNRTVPEVVEPEEVSEIVGPLTGLKPKQLRAAQFLVLGYNPSIVASKVGVSLTTISNWRKLDMFQKACDLLRAGGAEKIIAELEDFRSAEQILEDAAVRAAEKTTELMESADREETQLRAAESILDRTGRARKTEVHKHIVLVEADALALIEQTKQQIQEAEFELLTEGENDESDT